MVALVSNPCSTDLDFITVDHCLASTWEVASSSGSATAMVKVCVPGKARHTVPAGGTVESAQRWGTKRPGTYRLMVYFDDAASSTATTGFTVH